MVQTISKWVVYCFTHILSHGPRSPPFLDATVRRGLQQDPAVDNVVEVLLPVQHHVGGSCQSNEVHPFVFIDITSRIIYIYNGMSMDRWITLDGESFHLS